MESTRHGCGVAAVVVATAIAAALGGCDAGGGGAQEACAPVRDRGVAPQADAARTSDLGACVADPGSLAGCYVGERWAECPGTGPPRAYCGREGCKWLSGGEARGGLQTLLAFDCRCAWPSWGGLEDSATMASFLLGWGSGPWTRERALALPVTFDASLAAGTPKVSCTGCAGSCAHRPGPCEATTLRVSRNYPGTLVVVLGEELALAGWNVHLEFDLERNSPRARACRIPFTDAPRCEAAEPVCATEGRATLSARPCRERLGELHGRFEARFPDGVTMQGAF